MIAPPGAGEVDHFYQPVAVVPDVVGHRTRGDVGPFDAVPVGVVRIVVRSVEEGLVVRTGHVPAARAVAVGVVRVPFVGLRAAVGGTVELAVRVVSVVDGPVWGRGCGDEGLGIGDWGFGRAG